ncbi:2406_t:CDS:2 [Diversispora eburnea]|uniref:2406_t:CDS:1 n=1 Tax=Diversispora eburnea TaxID=1213867 RepID=A0A9N8YP53_9GLOM|nr:2406_t:CDS:2 [Diversispora eburnea]
MLLWEIAEGRIPFEDERDLIVICDMIVKQMMRPSFSSDVPPEWQKISYQAMQDNPNSRPALKDMFMTLYSLHQKYQPPRSPRPPTSNNEELELPPDDGDLEIGDFTINVLTVKDAINEHKKKNGDKKKVWESFKIHAEEFHDMTARYWMGYYLYYDLCPADNPIEKNVRLEQAASLFKEAADIGISDAQLRYGHCLWSGEGVKRNIKESMEYFQKSANNGNGNSTAMYNIGNIYFNGIGFPKDEEKGKRFLRLAALHGQPKALDMCRKKGISLAD